MVSPNERAQAVGRMMLGLTGATLAGVPVATWIGQRFGWRGAYLLVGAIGVLTWVLIARFVPRTPPTVDASPLRELRRTIGGLLIWNAVVLLLFSMAAPYSWAVVVVVLLVGTGVAIVPALQIRLMDVVEDAQTLAAALNHSAFNIANALGAWLGGVAISNDLGWASTGWVGSLLALGGLLIFAVAALIGQDRDNALAPSDA